MMKRYILLTVLVWILAGCDSETTSVSSQENVSSRTLPFKTLVQTGVSGVEKAEKVFKVLKDVQTLRLFYPKIEDELVKSIDFKRETLLGVYGGDAIRIVALEQREECTHVLVETKRFSEASPFYGIPYSPLHLVKVAGTEGCFKFDERVVVAQ